MHDHVMQYHVNTSWRVARAAVSFICCHSWWRRIIRSFVRYARCFREQKVKMDREQLGQPHGFLGGYNVRWVRLKVALKKTNPDHNVSAWHVLFSTCLHKFSAYVTLTVVERLTSPVIVVFYWELQMQKILYKVDIKYEIVAMFAIRIMLIFVH